jgi:hypothetical protein
VTARHSRGAGRVPVAPALAAVATHPSLWAAAIGQALRLSPRGWWHRWPVRPGPDPGLWRFRMETAYGGSGDARPSREDVRDYLRWCRERFRQ